MGWLSGRKRMLATANRAEGYQSGRTGLLGVQVSPSGLREFESHSLRSGCGVPSGECMYVRKGILGSNPSPTAKVMFNLYTSCAIIKIKIY